MLCSATVIAKRSKEYFRVGPQSLFVRRDIKYVSYAEHVL
jgi:hypothetical protein